MHYFICCIFENTLLWTPTHHLRTAWWSLVCLLLSACGAAPEVPFGPGAMPEHLWTTQSLSPVLQHAHPEEMPPTRFAVVHAAWTTDTQAAQEALSHQKQAQACTQTYGIWHAALWSCQCPARQTFWPRRGCQTSPPIVAAQSFCTEAWADAKTACLRDVQVGRLAWHLHFAGQTRRKDAVRKALVAADLGALVGHTLSLPTPDATWSLHLTDRLGPQVAADLGFDDQSATLWPEQYTQAWVRPTCWDTAGQDLPRLAETCRKALGKQPLLPSDTAELLCTHASAALRRIRMASRTATSLAEPLAQTADHQRHAETEMAWPEASSIVRQSSAAPGVAPQGSMTMLQWQLSAPRAPQVRAVCWRVVLRDEVVIARQVRIEAAAGDTSDANAATWTLTLVCDGVGAVQAWHVVRRDAPEATGLLLPCHKTLQPRQVKSKPNRL